MEFWSDLIWSDDYTFCEFKKPGVGRGHSKTGVRKKWKKKLYFEQDLFKLYQRTLDRQTFLATFAGYEPKEIDWFFNKIKANAIRPKETEWHCRNKLLM